MKYTDFTLTSFIVVSLLITACGYYIQHNPALAIAVAWNYSHYLFVEKDIPSAVRLTDHTEQSEQQSEDDIAKMLTEMHPDGEFPKSTQPIGYEIVPGKSLVNVYLIGIFANSRTYYCIVLHGDKNSYLVTEMYRKSEMFPTTSLYKSL